MRLTILAAAICCSASFNISFGATLPNPRGQSLNPRLATPPLALRDAKVQCGPNAPKGQDRCPLNVCCSEFGYVAQFLNYVLRHRLTTLCRHCGQSAEFCTWKGCDTKYGGCGDVSRPSCDGGDSVSKRRVGYYQSWATTRTCQKVSPEDLNPNGFTHINFAFSFFDPSTFEISPIDEKSDKLYSSFTGLKSKQDGLQTWISIGGWSFATVGPTRSPFSEMASNSDNREKFVNGLTKFMDKYGFDGVDLDWEYPGSDERGGKPEDTANYVLLAQELKAAFDSKYGISIALPASYWYLQYFDLMGIQDHVDWFNVMAYNLYKARDAISGVIGPHIAPHTSIIDIDAGFDLLWRAGVNPDKVVMGESWYGRSFTLKDPSCSEPNGICEYSGFGNAGPCSGEAGVLDNQEIQDIIKKNDLKPVHDEKAAVKWITWDDNQWVSFDDEDTFKEKRDFANSRCLGGLMVWAMDQVDQG